MIGFMMVIQDEQVRSKLEEIYVMYHRDMFVTAYSILKDHHEAEDVVQNVVLKLTKNSPLDELYIYKQHYKIMQRVIS